MKQDVKQGATTAHSHRCAVAVCVALASSVGCGRATTDRPPGPLASALVAVAAELGADPSTVADAWGDLQRIADRVESRNLGTHADKVDDLIAVIFDELGFEREITSDDPRFFQFPSVIAARRGSCLGLAGLTLALGERLDIPLDGVLLPGHFFVRTRGPHGRNIELLRRGEAMPDTWYRAKYGPWPERGGAYFRPVTVSELSAVHWYNAGNHHRRAGALPAAEHDYARAVATFPDFAEAQASLGAVRQIRGALTDAEASYREAARARADLPGLERNMVLLKQEQRLDSPQARRESP